MRYNILPSDLAEMRRKCEETIEYWEERSAYALNLIDKFREPLEYAEPRLDWDIREIINDYGIDHPELCEDRLNELDTDEILFFCKEDGLKLYCTEKVPEWALPAIFNDDWSGLTEEDAEQVRDFLEDFYGATFDVPRAEEPYFTAYPYSSFKGASDVVDVDIYF